MTQEPPVAKKRALPMDGLGHADFGLHVQLY